MTIPHYGYVIQRLYTWRCLKIWDKTIIFKKWLFQTHQFLAWFWIHESLFFFSILHFFPRIQYPEFFFDNKKNHGRSKFFRKLEREIHGNEGLIFAITVVSFSWREGGAISIFSMCFFIPIPKTLYNITELHSSWELWLNIAINWGCSHILGLANTWIIIIIMIFTINSWIRHIDRYE